MNPSTATEARKSPPSATTNNRCATTSNRGVQGLSVLDPELFPSLPSSSKSKTCDACDNVVSDLVCYSIKSSFTLHICHGCESKNLTFGKSPQVPQNNNNNDISTTSSDDEENVPDAADSTFPSATPSKRKYDGKDTTKKHKKKKQRCVRNYRSQVKHCSKTQHHHQQKAENTEFPVLKSPPSTTCEACDNLVDEEKVPDVADSTFSSNSSKKRKMDKQPKKKNNTKRRKNTKQKGQEQHYHQQEAENTEFPVLPNTLKLIKVMGEKELNMKRPKLCDTKGCNLASACVYTSPSCDEFKCNCCLDCQEVILGGWPQSEAEIPLKHMSTSHKNKMKKKCSNNPKVSMPDLPHCQMTHEDRMTKWEKEVEPICKALDPYYEQIHKDFPEASQYTTKEKFLPFLKKYTKKQPLTRQDTMKCLVYASVFFRSGNNRRFAPNLGEVPNAKHRILSVLHYAPLFDCNSEVLKEIKELLEIIMRNSGKLPEEDVEHFLNRMDINNVCIQWTKSTLGAHFFEETNTYSDDSASQQNIIVEGVCVHDFLPLVLPKNDTDRNHVVKDLMQAKDLNQDEFYTILSCIIIVKAKCIMGMQDDPTKAIPCMFFGNPANNFAKTCKTSLEEHNISLGLDLFHPEQWLRGKSGQPHVALWFVENKVKVKKLELLVHEVMGSAFAEHIEDGTLTLIEKDQVTFFTGCVTTDPAVIAAYEAQKKKFYEYMSKFMKEWWAKMSKKEREEHLKKMPQTGNKDNGRLEDYQQWKQKLPQTGNKDNGRLEDYQQWKQKLPQTGNKDNGRLEDYQQWKQKLPQTGNKDNGRLQEYEDWQQKKKAGYANMSEERQEKWKQNMSAAQVKVWKNMSHEDYQQRKQKNPSTGTKQNGRFEDYQQWKQKMPQTGNKDNGRLQEKEKWKQKVKDGMANMSEEKKKKRKEKISEKKEEQVEKMLHTKGKLPWNDMLQVCVEWMNNNKKEGHMILPKQNTQYRSPEYGLQNLGIWINTNCSSREKKDKLRKGLEAKGIEVEEVRLSGCSYSRYAFPSDE